MPVSPGEFRHDPEIPYSVHVIENPSQEDLRALSQYHTPHIYQSKYGNLNRITRCKARMAQSTYIIAPIAEQGFYSSKVMLPDRAARLIHYQREYIERLGTLLRIDGYQGYGPRATAVQWLYTPEGANLAGMQQVLSFPRSAMETKQQQEQPFRPHLRVIMTPGCLSKETPGEIAVIVDLERWTTYVLGSDYFGESKKGMLRMLNEYVYQLGGLVLHAGAKAVTIDGRRVMVAIMGLSGTGKTTTTFSHQGDLTEPIQDDMICLWPDGQCTVTENGCFAKIYGLREDAEPVIYRGTIHRDAWVENGYLDKEMDYDFSKNILSPDEVNRWRVALLHTGAQLSNLEAYVSGEVKIEDILDNYGVPQDGWDFIQWTQNGRSIIPMAAIESAVGMDHVPAVESLGMLNRDEGPNAATPGVIRFTSPEQAAAYFMLGETSMTSAAGKERGKTRSPFTQPFFPRAPYLQAKRFEKLAAHMPDLQLWLMNTGYVGGDQKDVDAGTALKVKIRHSSAMLEALLGNRIAWKKDRDFGYEIVDTADSRNAPLLEKVPDEILNPVLFFNRRGQQGQYREWVEQMKEDRWNYLLKLGVDEEILHQVHTYTGL
ncbi:MAG: phosphoenolpyruvate carboxykinase (ATP) [Candidatus Eisenbacteria sp.]|nr:phosphoenolpyruvate carboxykinase (ATP) [Candidatus Eisenbacteria bacterium]